MRSLAAAVQRDRREARAAPALAGGVRRRRLARAAHAADRAAASAREPAAEPTTATAALREADRLPELVDGLLALARADAGSEPSARVDAAALVRERVEAWLPLADEHGVGARRAARRAARRCALRPGVSRRCSTTSSPTRSRRRPPAATVTVSARVEAAAGSSSTSRDEGPGSTPEQRERAFDRFWRAGSGAGGSGLGLAIVKRLVEADDGQVELGEATGRRRRRRRAPASGLSLEPLPKLARPLARRLPAQA